MSQNLTAERIRAQSPFKSTPEEDILRARIWRRKQLASVTFGIELRGVSIMLESDWDRIAARIEPRVGTGNLLIDDFFAGCFSPMTTSWIHRHPELDKVGQLFDRYRTIMAGHFDFTQPRYAHLTKRKC